LPSRFDHEAAAAIMRAAGVEPIEQYPNSQSPWRCQCLACGNEVTPQLGNVRAGHAACGYCAGSKVDPVTAEAVMRAAGLIPLEGLAAGVLCDRHSLVREFRPQVLISQHGCDRPPGISLAMHDIVRLAELRISLPFAVT